MPTATRTEIGTGKMVVPKTMQAAVYRGKDDVRLETVAVPEIGAGELLVRIHTCGICGTDLKKISTGSHSAPRIFGHEMAGQVAAIGAGVKNFAVGDRVMVFHHIPCGECYYCRKKVFAQCPVYKKVGTTAGFEPSGGGFAEYIRVMDWIVRKGVVKIPDQVSYEQASFIEPVNTCMKAIEALQLQPDETVLVIGQGPIGVMLAVLGADAVILATAGNSLIKPAMDATRPGGRVMLFAQTQRSEVAIDPAAVCVDEKTLLGSYSASVDLQQENVQMVFSGEIDFARLISHRFPLAQAVEALRLASHPGPGSLKIVIQPGMDWEKSI